MWGAGRRGRIRKSIKDSTPDFCLGDPSGGVTVDPGHEV